MNITQLKYFLAVCEYRSMSAAAEALYISQPSLSGAVRSLEQEFGVRLFERRYHGMTLTAEGEALRKMGQDLLEHTEQVERAMHDLGSEQKVLRLGIPPMIGAVLLPGIYRGFLAENPDIRLEIQEEGRQVLLSKLSADLVDMVFLPHTAALDRNLQTQQVAEFETVCCAAKGHPVTKQDAVSPSDLENAPLVLFKDSFFHTEQIKTWFASAGVRPNILLQTGQLSTLKSMIRGNGAVGFLFRQLMEPELVAVPLQEPLYVKVSLVWKKDAQFFGSMRRFQAYITKSMR